MALSQPYISLSSFPIAILATFEKKYHKKTTPPLEGDAGGTSIALGSHAEAPANLEAPPLGGELRGATSLVSPPLGGGSGGASLYLLPVPLSDVEPASVLPPVNIDTVRRLRYFVVENLRTARRWLKRCDRAIDIDSLTFSILNVDTPAADVAAMLAPLERGEDMGLMSEAGCPGVADPGALLVAEAQRRGYRVVPLVGPSSILLALMASGFNGQSFTFNGYLPIDASARTAAIRRLEREVATHGTTQIFIETPYRNNRLIAELTRTLSPRTLLCVASDITGQRESIITKPVSHWARDSYDYAKVPTIFLIGRS